MRRLLAHILFALMTLLPGYLRAAPSEPLSGPIKAEVERVIDGDTIEVRARIWLDQEVVVRVRLSGIDTPEITQADCPAERAKGLTARARLISLIQDQTVHLRDIHYGKYAGRVVARVETDQGLDISTWLLTSGLAAKYIGKSINWCTDRISKN
jgi:endonuclease YncB( thermonuclease family)